MSGDAGQIDARSNGDAKLRLLTRDQLDGRTSAAKQFDTVARQIAADLGGEDRLSAVEKHLIAAFAGVSVHLNDLHARMLLGEKVDIAEHAVAVSTMVRVASRVGIRRVRGTPPQRSPSTSRSPATRRLDEQAQRFKQRRVENCDGRTALDPETSSGMGASRDHAGA